MNYTTTEKIAIIKWYYAGNSMEKVSEMFSVEFPDRSIPNKSTVQRVVKNFEASGTVLNNYKCENDADEKRGQRRVNNAELDILLSVQENLEVSTRQLGKMIGIHSTTVFRV
ncbi:hypothetical protein ILUMI_26258 [Ignelater luminosus]|uniref:DUF4817 domain-containing protein n=1 Tax=Ignelater luminosus TaxID=2038154 RepID=A0A8K0FZA8_IGNLU|nr:hypothetical protein ILUMI_26258 [Ignelater luminosus]